MSRMFSIWDRAPGFIDLVTSRQDAHTGYSLRVASNFDQPFSEVLSFGVYGHMDASLRDRPISMAGTTGVRVIFNPLEHGLTDGPLWLQVVPLVEAVEQTPSNPLYVMAAGLREGWASIAGVAPNAVSVADSLVFDLQRQMEGVSIRNTGSAPLMVALGEGSAEMTVPAGTERSTVYGTVSTLCVRGSGADVSFSMTFSYNHPR